MNLDRKKKSVNETHILISMVDVRRLSSVSPTKNTKDSSGNYKQCHIIENMTKRGSYYDEILDKNNTPDINPALSLTNNVLNGAVPRLLSEEEAKGNVINEGIQVHLNKLLKILLDVQNLDPEVSLSTSSIFLLEKVSVVIEKILSPYNTNDDIRFNTLGLPMHPLEKEVADMLDRARVFNLENERNEEGKGYIEGYIEKRIFPKYNRKIDGSLLEYLEKYYGRFLKAFGAEDDFLYQHQLNVIDSKFRNNLRRDLKNNTDHIKKYIPIKSKLLDKELKTYSDSSDKPILGDDKIKKFVSLQQVKNRRQ